MFDSLSAVSSYTWCHNNPNIKVETVSAQSDILTVKFVPLFAGHDISVVDFVTNSGNAGSFLILATVAQIMQHYLKNVNQPQHIIFTGATESRRKLWQRLTLRFGSDCGYKLDSVNALPQDVQLSLRCSQQKVVVGTKLQQS